MPPRYARSRAGDGRWHIAEGNHEIALATAADTPVLTAEVTMEARAFGH